MKYSANQPLGFLITDHLGKIESGSPETGNFLLLPAKALPGLYQKLRNLEQEPDRNYLASHLHLQQWAEQQKQDICEAIHTLFEKSTNLLPKRFESAL
jgi:hypothetical protein